MPQLPVTQSEVWYAYSISLQGVNVGTLRTFNPTQTRTFEYVREIATNGGHIFEGVPGVTDYTIRLEKVRLYENELFNNFGISTKDIQNQVRALDITEEIHRPANIQNKDVSDPSGKAIQSDSVTILNYKDCWITDWGKSVSTTAVTIVENMTVKGSGIN